MALTLLSSGKTEWVDGLEGAVDETIRRWTAMLVADAAHNSRIACAVRRLQSQCLELLRQLHDELDSMAPAPPLRLEKAEPAKQFGTAPMNGPR